MTSHSDNSDDAGQEAGPTAGKPKNVYAAPALDKAFDVIELLAQAPDGLTLTEIAARLQRSLSELFRIVVVMERRGYLIKNPDTDRLVVAYKLLDLAYRATPARHLTKAAVPVMQALARDIGQSCHLVVRNRASGLVIAREKGSGASGFSVQIGVTIDLAQSCSGHVILAFSAPARTAEMLDELSAVKGSSIRELKERIALVAERGYDRQPSPITYGVTDMSYPVLGLDGYLIAALTIPFLERIDGSQPVDMEAAREQLAAAAQTISTRLGWRGHAAPDATPAVVEPPKRAKRSTAKG
ncbi:IclR family transcriptional regulator [uncultured Sphingomonas sp.]|uniref:IclR family transcriptional regulator n=1 Tax=uncultured Sphingomonas sp. TaxID=158754 RepID=UPI0035CAD82E